MAGGKETPRQKMIGLMYLVLTAMLALNVSKSILNGYLSVNDSLEKAKKNITENNVRVTDAFQASINGNQGAAPYFKEAQVAQKNIDEVFRYVDVVKGNMVRYVVGYDDNVKMTGDTINLRKEPYYANIGNYDKPSTIMLGTGDHPAPGPLTAVELGQKMTELHKKLSDQVERMQKTEGLHLMNEDYINLKKKIDILKPQASGFVEDGHEFTWEDDVVNHLPMAAVFVNLNKIQVDLKNVESDILQVYSGASGKLAIKPDRLLARVVAPSSYISAGQPYTADIFLSAAFSKLGTGDMEVIMGVDSASAAKGAKGNLVPLVGGMGKYEVNTGAVGDQKYHGVIKFKKPDGTFEYYPFDGEYKVAKSAVAVSADMMNVFYAGVENPVSAGAAGVSPNDIVLNASGAGVRFKPKGEAGKYIFEFSGTGECNITVSKRGPDGVKAQGPPQKFRVKPLPKPDLKIGGAFSPSEMKKDMLATVRALGAGAIGFDFQANYRVVEWEISGTNNKGKYFPGIKGNGSTLSAEALSLLSAPAVGSKIYFDAKIQGPDGKFNSVTQGVKVQK